MIARLMGLPVIAPRELHRRLASEALVVFDLNSAASWATHHVPGAIHLEPAALAPEVLPADHEVALVFYCSNPFCRKAPNAARRARAWGWRNVSVMSAGITGWLAATLPAESAPER